MAYGCLSAVEAGQFTVPSYIPLGLRAGSGGMTVDHRILLTFSATGLAPAAAALTGEIEFSAATTYK